MGDGREQRNVDLESSKTEKIVTQGEQFTKILSGKMGLRRGRWGTSEENYQEKKGIWIKAGPDDENIFEKTIELGVGRKNGVKKWGGKTLEENYQKKKGLRIKGGPDDQNIFWKNRS